MTSYTEDYLKEKLTEKLKAVHVVSLTFILKEPFSEILEKKYANKCQNPVRTQHETGRRCDTVFKR